MSCQGATCWAVAYGGLALGCSFGTFQTGHTQPPGTVSAVTGGAYVSNRSDDEQGRDISTNLGAQLGARVGISQRVDVGLGTFMGYGLQTDVKVNLLDPQAKLALSPRLGAGYRHHRREIGMLEGGAIMSYRLPPHFEPYLGLTFANHWIGDDSAPPEWPLPPNVVGRKGTGDGLLKLSVGIELLGARHFAVLLEYDHWFPINDDPGDFYRFLPTNIFGVAFRFGRVLP